MLLGPYAEKSVGGGGGGGGLTIALQSSGTTANQLKLVHVCMSKKVANNCVLELLS